MLSARFIPLNLLQILMNVMALDGEASVVYAVNGEERILNEKCDAEAFK
jgi:hypothetical protein